MHLTLGIVLLLSVLSAPEASLLWQRLAIHKAGFMAFGLYTRDLPYLYMNGVIIDRLHILMPAISCEVK